MEKLNVAIADDNERMVDLLSTLVKGDKELELVGQAADGQEIYKIIKEKEPDVVLLDIIMPKMDGITVMEKLNEDPSVRKRPAFIIISAVGQERIIEDAFRLGACYYIMKPFDQKTILDRIKSVHGAKPDQTVPQVWKRNPQREPGNGQFGESGRNIGKKSAD